eukprot:s1118_g1.t1
MIIHVELNRCQAQNGPSLEYHRFLTSEIHGFITSSTTTTSTSSTTTTTFLGRILRTQVLYKGIWVWRTFHEEFEVDNATFDNSSLVPSDFALQDYTHIMMYLQSSFSRLLRETGGRVTFGAVASNFRGRAIWEL